MPYAQKRPLTDGTERPARCDLKISSCARRRSRHGRGRLFRARREGAGASVRLTVAERMAGCELYFGLSARENLEGASPARAAGAGGRHGVRRHCRRRARRGVRRDLLQYLPGGVSGNRHRPLLCGPDRGADLPAGGQLRGASRRRPGAGPGALGARGARSVRGALQLAVPGEPGVVPGTRGRRGHQGGGYPRARLSTGSSAPAWPT